jgi:hypothetical protein
MDPQPAIKFAAAEKVPLGIARHSLSGPIHLFEAIAEIPAVILKRSAEKYQITSGRRDARNRLQTLVRANVRFGSKADISRRKGNVRFTPIATLIAFFGMSALGHKADIGVIRSPRRRDLATV